MKGKYLLALCVICFVTFGYVSCVTYRPVDVTNTMAAQLEQVHVYNLQPGDKVNTLYIKRQGSFIRDLNAHKSGWYFDHQNKIVSVEAVRKQTRVLFFRSLKDNWRIEYVD